MTSCKPPPTCIDASPTPDANDSRMSAIPYEANLTPRGPTPLCAKIAAALRDAVCAAQRTAVAPPVEGADPAPRWTLRRLVGWVRERFGLVCCRETVRAALHRLKL